jgi:hypothetical protein
MSSSVLVYGRTGQKEESNVKRGEEITKEELKKKLK